ncbi:MAG: UvrD-helicase domain-containing protein [Anaerolineaceae bacterium]|nr:UvrD-helicase domain-containing protein [Anaerolineaceae bacterium]
MKSHTEAQLNQKQNQAVTSATGQALVLAGPGSGKTRVLTYRIAHLIQEMAINPYQILAVTFTNKAARQMADRLDSLIGGKSHGLWLGTFHSVCGRILRREAQHLPFDSNYVIFDADDQLAVIKQVFKEFNINDKIYRPQSIHSAISNAKNELIPAEDYIPGSTREELVAKVYLRYQKLLMQSNALDFDDLLLWTVRLLVENNTVRQRYAQQFEHMLVDEFQDTNKAQYQLLYLLSSVHHNLYVVGDEDQSIYRWRGADYHNVIRFEKDYPTANKILLEENYRSTQTILDAAQAVINQNKNRTPKHLSAARNEAGEKLQYFEADDGHHEAEFVVSSIRTAMQSGERGRDIAIMYRTNAQSRLLEEAFLHASLSYRLVGAQRFYGRREVKDMIAYLRLIFNPADQISLMRAINTPRRGIGPKKLEELAKTAFQGQTTSGEVLLDMARNGEKSAHWIRLGSSAAILRTFGLHLLKWVELLDGGTVSDVFDSILTDVDYHAYLDDGTEEGAIRWENVQELRKLAYEYNEKGMVEFLENLALVSDQDTIQDSDDAPTLLTLHAAKGLEYKRVYIIGLDEGLIPHNRSIDSPDPEEMDEERRLLYVGMTRAKDVLYLIRADQRSQYGSFTYSTASRFLDDIPRELMQQQGLRPVTHRNVAANWKDAEQFLSRLNTNNQPPAAAKPTKELLFAHPMRVTHAVWGEGIVLDSKLEDGCEIVEINFASVGMKRVDAELARLEIIS